MAKQSVRDLGDAELIDELARAEDELFGSLEGHHQMRGWRQQIARINTELRDREIAAAETATAGEA